MLLRRVSHSLPGLGQPRSARGSFWPFEGPRTDRATPPERRAATPARTTCPHRQRPDDARHDRGRTPPRAAQGLDRHARDAAAMAPPPNRQALDPSPGPAHRSATHQRRAASPDRGPSKGEPDLGTPPHPGRTRSPRPHDRQDTPCGRSSPTAASNPLPEPLRGDSERVPALPGRGRVRLLSPSTPLLFAATTCCSSSTSRPGRYSSPAPPQTPPAPGPPRQRATCCCATAPSTGS